MNRNDVIDLLSAISGFDQRTIGEDDITAWTLVVGDLNRAEALEAVVIHHKVSAERIKPFHVVQLAKQMRADRLARAGRLERERRDAERDQRLGLPAVASSGVPSTVRAVRAAYEVNGALGRDCPHPKCGRPAGRPCVNPVTGLDRKAPCSVRLSGAVAAPSGVGA